MKEEEKQRIVLLRKAGWEWKAIGVALGFSETMTQQIGQKYFPRKVKDKRRRKAIDNRTDPT
jgi:hypothetical protein